MGDSVNSLGKAEIKNIHCSLLIHPVSTVESY